MEMATWPGLLPRGTVPDQGQPHHPGRHPIQRGHELTQHLQICHQESGIMLQLESSRHSLFTVYMVKPVPRRAAQQTCQFGRPVVLQEAQVVQPDPRRSHQRCHMKSSCIDNPANYPRRGGQSPTLRHSDPRRRGPPKTGQETQPQMTETGPPRVSHDRLRRQNTAIQKRQHR